jgi:pseudouridine-5'-phosphate glycosidase
MNALIVLNDEVAEAVQTSKPIVALESTIIAHGMPYPKNVETALAVEDIIRQQGAVPATIAIFDGQCHVGLDKEQVTEFGRRKDVLKVSMRDLPYVISKKLYGATTVAATMRIAAMAGIKVFVTGGIGGVHRGAEKTMDISADLVEMSHTSVTVVSAGIKSILDIGLTLEYLETMGIPVASYGQDEFPSFYSSKSGYMSPLRVDSPAEIAAMMHAKRRLELNGAILIAAPVPASQEIGADEMEKHILDALKAADENNIKGKSVTPFLLSYIAGRTKGESLEANIALIKNNAQLGAAIATAYAQGYSD